LEIPLKDFRGQGSP